MRNLIRFSLVAASLFILSGGSAWAQTQTPAQQKCINAMNKNGTKLNETQCTENRACIKDFGQGRLGVLTAEDCLTADRLGKILKREGKTSAHEGDFCTTPGVVPDFAKMDSATVNAAAEQASMDLVHDLFGNPIQGGLFPCNTDPEECYCQRFMSKWIHKLTATMPRVFRKCKKAALKVGKDPFFDGADSVDDVETCWDNSVVFPDPPNLLSVAADPNNQLQKIIDNLTEDFNDLCVGHSVDTTVFPGPSCNGLGGDTARDCVVDRVQCRTCLMINAMDNLTIDCDTFDNGLADLSCP